MLDDAIIVTVQEGAGNDHDSGEKETYNLSTLLGRWGRHVGAGPPLDTQHVQCAEFRPGTDPLDLR